MALQIGFSGLVVETLQEIATAIGNDQLANIDAGLSQDDDDPLRQMNVIVAREIQEAVEAIQVAYTAFDIDNAEDELLDNIGAFKGRARLQAQNPRAAVTLNLAAGAIVAVGDQVKSNINNAKTWQSTVAFVAATSGYYSTVFEATDPSFSVAAGELTIYPAITGWVGATNPSPSSPLRQRESDETYRLRLKTNSDTDNGAGTLSSIVDEVSQLDGIVSADGIENTSLTVAVNGLPGMSFEIIVDDANGTGSSPALIAQTIFDNKPPGGRSYGTILTTAFDKKGRQQGVYWSRATNLRIYVYGSLVVLPGWSIAQIDNIKQRIYEVFAQQRQGQDVIAGRVKAAILAEPLVYDVNNFSVGVVPGIQTYPATDRSYPIDIHYKATFQLGDFAYDITQLTESTP